MSEPNPIMAMILDHNSFLGQAESVENEIMPLDAQLNFGPGDVAILAATDTPLERDFVVVRGLDPEKHTVAYPDWEERLLNSFVLCEFFSKQDPEITIGWVSRLKLMPISQYRYKECRRWLKNGFPSELPDWPQEYYQKYTDALSERAPSTVPQRVKCPNCGSRDVELQVRRHLIYRAAAGRLRVNDADLYVPVSDIDETSTHTALLHCTSCHSSGEMEDDEWKLPGHSN